MSNSPNGFELNFADKLFFSVLFVLCLCIILLAGALLDAQDSARAERAQAWQALIEAAPTVEEREVISHYASRVQGCFVHPSVDPERLSFSVSPSRYQENYLAHLIAHEQACLTNLRGEARASTPEFQDMIFAISVPR